MPKKRLTLAPVRWFARIPRPLGQKIRFILLVLILIVTLTGIASILLLLGLTSKLDTDRQGTQAVEFSEALNQFVDFQLDSYGDAVMVTRQSVLYDNYSPRVYDAAQKLRQTDFLKLSANQPIVALLDQFGQEYPQLVSTFDKINSLLADRQPDQARVLFQQNMNQMDKVHQLANSARNKLVELRTAIQNEVQVSVLTTIIFTIILVSLTVIILITISSFLTAALGGSMRQLKRELDVVAAGNLNVELATEHRDEIGEVVSVLNRAFGLIRHVISNSAIGSEVNGLAEHLAATSRQQSTLATEQVSLVQLINTNLNDLTASVRQILHNAGEVAKSAEFALNEAEEVRQGAVAVDEATTEVQNAVASSNEVMNYIRGQAVDLGERLHNLEMQSREIAHVTNFIRNIAGQTHILAINASIEAAGAGTYGVRFAIIAGQIRTLALQVTGNAEKIRELLEVTGQGIQEAATEAQTLLGQTGKLTTSQTDVNAGISILTQKAREASAKAQQIVEAARSTALLTHAIESATANHERTSLQVVSRLREIHNVAQINQESSQALEKDSGRLENLSHQLNLALSQVRLA